jgi:hypothetical protein
MTWSASEDILPLAHRYTSHGLTIDSALMLPELLPARSGDPAPAEVHIRLGRVPTCLEHPLSDGVLYQAEADRFLFAMEGVARYLVEKGTTITIDPSPPASEDVIRLFLLGSPFGALLHQRGILALHGSAVQTSRGAAIFLGASGTGKSALAGTLLQRGYPILADEICAISCPQRDHPWAHPAYPRLSLWLDTLQALAISPGELSPVRSGLHKYILPLAECFAKDACPVHAVYILALYNANDFMIERVEKHEKFLALVNHTYRKQFLTGPSQRRAHFQHLAALADHVQVSRIYRPNLFSSPAALTDLVEKEIG